MLLSLLAARAKPTVAKKKQGQPKPVTLPGAAFSLGFCNLALETSAAVRYQFHSSLRDWTGASEPKPPIKDYLASEEARSRSSYPDRSRCSGLGISCAVTCQLCPCVGSCHVLRTKAARRGGLSSLTGNGKKATPTVSSTCC